MSYEMTRMIEIELPLNVYKNLEDICKDHEDKITPNKILAMLAEEFVTGWKKSEEKEISKPKLPEEFIMKPPVPMPTYLFAAQNCGYNRYATLNNLLNSQTCNVAYPQAYREQILAQQINNCISNMERGCGL